MLELRHKMWVLAEGVLTDAANARTSMPFLTDDEYEYARDFLLNIARNTRPGGYREHDDDRCDECGENVDQSSHYHCGVCNEVCSLAGHPECLKATNDK